MKKKRNFLLKSILLQLNFSLEKAGILLVLVLVFSIQAKVRLPFFIPGRGSKQIWQKRYRCERCGSRRFSRTITAKYGSHL